MKNDSLENMSARVSDRTHTVQTPQATILKYCKRRYSLLKFLTLKERPASGTWELTKNCPLDPQNVGFPFRIFLE
jgi:hypothetical protein